MIQTKSISNATDDKVKITSFDTTEDYLDNKIVVGSNKLVKTILNPAGDEDLQVDIDETKINHDNLLNFVGDEHIDHSGVSISGAGLLVGQGGDITTNRVFTLNNSDIDHNSINNTHNLTTDIIHANISGVGSNSHDQIDAHLALVNEHIDWTNASDNFETSGEVSAQVFSGWGIVPIGGVVAWLKSFTGTPSLPDGLVECNGQVLNDSESVYNGRTLPDLNSGTYHRFLRGAATSGSTGGEVTHKHDFLAYRVGVSLGLVYYYFPANNTTYYVTMYPRYYDVVWVMRVK